MPTQTAQSIITYIFMSLSVLAYYVTIGFIWKQLSKRDVQGYLDVALPLNATVMACLKYIPSFMYISKLLTQQCPPQTSKLKVGINLVLLLPVGAKKFSLLLANISSHSIIADLCFSIAQNSSGNHYLDDGSGNDRQIYLCLCTSQVDFVSR